VTAPAGPVSASSDAPTIAPTTRAISSSDSSIDKPVSVVRSACGSWPISSTVRSMTALSAARATHFSTMAGSAAAGDAASPPERDTAQRTYRRMACKRKSEHLDHLPNVSDRPISGPPPLVRHRGDTIMSERRKNGNDVGALARRALETAVRRG